MLLRMQVHMCAPAWKDKTFFCAFLMNGHKKRKQL